MNNIFKYATKELSQDAFLCWSINWLNEGADSPLYDYGKAVLSLFLRSDKQEQYSDVKVLTQYEKIDILVLFKDKAGNNHALIIEDKTNTSEHGNQMQRYRDKLVEKLPYDDTLKIYKNPKVHLAYVKTGIMYDEDVRMVGKGATVVNLEMLLKVVSDYASLGESEILSQFKEHLQEIKEDRDAIEGQIKDRDYESALESYYGQFYFLDKIFSGRSKGTQIGYGCVKSDDNWPVYMDYIYAGTNRGGRPWIEYNFWSDKYPINYKDENINEYHSMFWRIDCKWKKVKSGEKTVWKPEYYIALRHYDAHAHSGVAYLDERKRFVYRKLRSLADKLFEDNPEIYTRIGVRENYKESDLLFIPIGKIKDKSFEDMSRFLNDITDSFIKECDGLYEGL